MIKKLRIKFILIATSVIFIVIGTLIGILNVTNYLRIDSDTDKVLSLLASNGGVMPLPPFIEEENRMEEFSPEMPFRTRYFTVTLKDGEVAETNITQIAAIDEEDAKKYAVELYNSKKSEGYYNDYKFIKINLESGEKYIFLDCVSELSNFKSFLGVSVITGLSVIVLIFILIWIFSFIAVKPIAESYEKQKRFITDANHEIKTPLTIINATNEIMEIEFGKNEWSQTISNQIRKLNNLTEKLVFLSRMDEENANIPMAEFDLSETIIEVASSFNNVATVSQKSFNVHIEPLIKYVGDISLVGQLVSILLENAFKYCVEKGEINLKLIRANGEIKLTVENSVEKIDEKNLNKLFDRFYRLDESRNSETGGSGIGLSIAKSIVNIHKGKIFVRSEKNNFIVFSVIF